MPVLDKPLSELRTYMGVNPRPSDFDKYWEESLAEMRAVERNVEIIPDSFKTPYADCYHLFFTGVGGARIHAKLLKPKKIEGKCPALLNFHGYHSYSGGWCEYLHFAAAGFIVAALDTRGQSGLSEDVGGHFGNTVEGHIIRGIMDDDPKKLLFRDIFLDTAELADIIMGMDDVDETRVGAYGGSQGGGLTLACVSLEPRINRAAPSVPFLSDYKRVWEMDLTKDAYKELRTHFRMHDPRHEREDEIFTKLGYIDVQHLAPRIKSKIKLFTGLMDNICPPSTQFAAYNKITSEKEIVIYHDFGHENLPDSKEMLFEYMAEML